MKICLQASPLCAVVASNTSLYCCNVWPVTLRAGDKLEPTEEAGQRHSWQGLAAAAWRKEPWIGSSPHTLGKEAESQVWGAQLWPCLLAHGGAGVWDGPSRARLLPAEEPWLCKGHGRQGDGEPTGLSPATYLSPWCKLGLQNMHGAPWLCDHSVALSKAVQDMLQTPWSSQTNPSSWNCCMQIPTLSMAIKTRNGLHLFPLNTDTYHS